MAELIEVRIAGRGVVRGDEVTRDGSTVAHCDVCNNDVALVVSLGSEHACKECIRVRLDATSVAAWQLRDPGAAGLPWGKISG